MNHRLRIFQILKIILASLVISAPVIAQVSTPAIIDGNQCRSIMLDSARVACYDALTDNENNKNRPNVPVQQPAVQNNTNSRLQEEYRVMQEELARRRNEAESDQGFKQYGLKDQRVTVEDGKEVIYDRIAALEEVYDGWLVTLESGQMWKQMSRKTYMLKVGQQVKISPAMWGDSFHLSVKELGSFIQVKRVK